jgi:hypothetical protein
MKKETLVFLGIADFFQENGAPYPVGGADCIQLSTHKRHIVYPGVINGQEWIILANTQFLKTLDFNKWKIRVADEKDNELCHSTFATIPSAAPKLSKPGQAQEGKFISIFSQSEYSMIHFSVGAVVPCPGRYMVQSIYDNGKPEVIGSITFHYNKAPIITPDQIKAIEADPNAGKAVRMDLGCKFCTKKLRVYTALKRSSKMEQDGCTWYTDLDKDFECKCGKTKHVTKYLKESMHGLLLKNFDVAISGLSYIRQYGHAQVTSVVEKFTTLLEAEKLEQPVQKFIEQHPILLSRFHAKRLFIKPGILGRFEADFALVDSKNQFWLIELERPAIKLFKKNGHPSADLMHAYDQVVDWISKYNKYSAEILDYLGLKEHEIVAVRGAVIAGRNTDLLHQTLQRHLTNPPYPNVEFMTFDDLGASLLQISKKLA